MRGVDVQRIMGSTVAEDKQDIEEATIKSTRSASVEELDQCKKQVDQPHISKPVTEQQQESPPKTVKL